MAKTQVYSWRLSPELKHRLDARARAEGVSVAELVERSVREWLDRHVDVDEGDQRRRHRAAAPCLGSLAGSDPARSTRVRERVRERLAPRRRARTS